MLCVRAATVLVGINGDAECVIQGFTSSLARLHCIINAAGLPPPTTYDSAGEFQDLPLCGTHPPMPHAWPRVTPHHALTCSGLCHKRYVIKDGKHADCWHVGGTNHGCFLRFDLGGTPRITHVKTAVLQASAFMRLGGSGIDGGLLGAPLAGAKLHREYLTKGPASIEGDGTNVGCASRYDDTDSPSTVVALGYTDSTSYSCKVEALKGASCAPRAMRRASWHTPTPSHCRPFTPSPNFRVDLLSYDAYGLAAGGLAAGFFNVSLEVFAKDRGLAYHDAQRQARCPHPLSLASLCPPIPTTLRPTIHRPQLHMTHPSPPSSAPLGGHCRRSGVRRRARAAHHRRLAPPRLARRR